MGADISGQVEAKPDAIRVGIFGAFKVGCWTPLEIAVGSAPAADCRLEVEAPDPEGSAVTYRSEPGKSGLMAGGAADPHRIGLLFKMGRLDGTLRVRVLDGERTLINKAVRVSADPDADVPAPLRQSMFLVANVQTANEKTDSGSTKPEINLLRRLLAADSESAPPTTRMRTRVVDVLSYELLPTRVEAYDAIDAVLLTDRYDLDAERSRTLETWVRSGGHLVISIGRAGNQFSKSPLASWLPVKVEGTVKLRDLSPVESFCRQSSRIMGATDDPLDAAKLSAPGGLLLIPSLAGPLLCRMPYGLGRVTVFGLDLDAPQIAQWSAAPDLTQRIFDIEESQARKAQTVSNRLTQTGVTELATQLDGSLDEFAPVSRFTMWHVMGLLAALVLVVGPLDFLLVHKLFRRPELTWITLPVIALIAAGSVVYWSSAAKGNRLLLNQLDVLDVDAASGWVHSRSECLLYSPENRRFNVTADADPPTAASRAATSEAAKNQAGQPDGAAEIPVRVGWHGRPETSFGGMYRTGGVEISRPSYTASPGSRELDELPISVWSTKSLEAEWSARKPGIVESQLESRGPGHLGGTLRHNFPEPIEDRIVAFGHQVYRPRLDELGRPLPLLARSAVGASTRPRNGNLGGYLTGPNKRWCKSQIGHLDES